MVSKIPTNEHRDSNPSRFHPGTLLLLGGLAAWIILIALGTYWFDRGQPGEQDWRKPIMVLGGSGFFVFFWLFMLFRRRNQKPSGQETGDPQPKTNRP